MILSKKKVTTIISVLSVMGLAFTVIDNSNEPNDRSSLRSLGLGEFETTVQSSAVNPDNKLAEHLEALSQEVLVLRQNQTQMDEAVNKLARMLRKLDEQKDLRYLDQGNEMASDDIVNAAYHPSDDEFAQTRIEHYESSLGSEFTDSNWSSEAYEKVDSMIQDQSFGDSRIVSMDCGETLCKLDLTHVNADAMDNFLGELPHRMAWNNDSFIKTEDQGDGSIRTKVYFSRDGQTLPSIN